MKITIFYLVLKCFNLVGAGGLVPEEKPQATDQTTNVDGLEIMKENGVCTIKFNRPKKLNAINREVRN